MHVEIDLLTDLFDGERSIARARQASRVVRPPVATFSTPAAIPASNARPAATSPALRSLSAKTWREVKIKLVDGETILVDIAGNYQRLTYVDLGLAGTRNRKPVKAWALLRACCEARDVPLERLRRVREREAIVTRLRRAMCTAFGMDDDPFEKFSYKDQWRTRFKASVD